MAQAQVDLTPRQRAILCRVVEEYVASGQPVGSKYLVQSSGMAVSSSTVRAELAELEERGLLTHPHTSAGRVPTQSGYRLYADELLGRLDQRPAPSPLDLSSAQAEVDAALQATTEQLSEVTRLLALASAPPLETTTVRHVEVLLLQPRAVMVVIITSTGGVTKRMFTFDAPVDAGLAAWAREYLNEQVAGLRLGTSLLRQRFDDPELGERERSFLATLRPAFTELVREEERLFVGGAGGLLDEVRGDDLASYRRLFELLEQRAALLQVLRDAVRGGRPFIRVGGDSRAPALGEVALAGATYGLVNRTLGAVSVLGPLRMDYEKAIRSAQAAAHELSRFVEDVYEEG